MTPIALLLVLAAAVVAYMTPLAIAKRRGRHTALKDLETLINEDPVSFALWCLEAKQKHCEQLAQQLHLRYDRPTNH